MWAPATPTQPNSNGRPISTVTPSRHTWDTAICWRTLPWPRTTLSDACAISFSRKCCSLVVHHQPKMTTIIDEAAVHAGDYSGIYAFSWRTHRFAVRPRGMLCVTHGSC